MNGNEMILVYRTSPEKVKAFREKADLKMFIDFNDPERLEKAERLFFHPNIPGVLIDHHPNPKDFVDLVFSEPRIGSSAELVYRIICEAWLPASH